MTSTGGLRPCIIDGCSRLARGGPRCAQHETIHQSQRNSRRTWYQKGWQSQSITARRAHVQQHGLTCPGIATPPHRVATIGDLTLDHTTGRVLCLACNINAGPAPR
jgi:hypothetical protein